jgi:REP element-mobilizing transposase RayT
VPLEIGGVSDHVHLLTGLKPTHCVADVLQKIKKASSEWARHEMGCDQFHWQDGYSAFTVGRKGIDALRRYISTQEEHHQTRTFEEEYREFLRLNGISFDERYLL